MTLLLKKFLLLYFLILLSPAFSFGNPAVLHIVQPSPCDTAFAGTDQVLCADSSSLSANTPVTGTGAWTIFSGSGTFSDAASPTSAITGLAQGTNIFIWTISGGSCPTVTDSVTLFVDSIPTNSILGPDQEICATSITLTGNTPTIGTGEWGIISGSATIANSFSPTTTFSNLGVGPTVIRWKITHGSCASYDDITIIRDAPTVQATAGIDQTVCASASTFLGGNTPPYGSGVWTLVSGTATIDNSINSGTSLSNLGAGLSVFAWTLSNGVCPVTSDTATVFVDAVPTVAACGPDDTLCGSSSTLSANFASKGTGLWTVVTGGATVFNTASQNSPVTNLGTGINTFVWTISNGVCPSTSDTLNIYNQGVPTTPDAGPDQEICALSSVFAANTPVNGTGTWSLVSGAGNVVSASSPTSIVSSLSAGQNVFVWTIANGMCASLTDTVIIKVDAPSTNANAGPDFSACGTGASLSASSPSNGTGTWSVVTGSGNFALPNSGITAVSGLTTGANTFVWTIQNGVCPASRDTVIVTSILPASVANAGANQHICADTISLSANSPAVGAGSWTIVTPGPTLSSATSPSVLASNLIVGQNVFIWEIVNGVCPHSTDSVIVNVDAYPTVASAGIDVSSDQSIVTLAGNTPVIGAGVWNNLSPLGNVLSPYINNSSFTADASGDFLLTWTIRNGLCPASTDTVLIHLDFAPIPDVITPNGDGKNDAFIIKSLLFSSRIKLTVFNRWGNVVYMSEDYQHDFDGRNNDGVDLAEDTYFYSAELNGFEKFKGYFLIKRK